MPKYSPLKAIIPVLIFIAPLISMGQNKKWPNTLLWRISGNGLSKPSYLYGTMHMQDKRLFNFSDSTYAAIEKTEGLALEINFNELIDSMFRREMLKTENDYLDNVKVKINKKIISRSADSILKKFGFKTDNLTRKQLKEIRDYRVNNLSANNQMSTIVDGYLYGIAMRMDKWLGGIEDVTDQLNLKDEIGEDINPEEVFAPDEKLKRNIEKLSGVYSEQDLQAINDFSYNGDNPEFTRLMLINRNIKMAKRMDSLANIRSMFFAVGAAHLPGDSGVISFLRRRGFQVEPVFSSKKIDPELYAKKLATIPWKSVKDENNLYTIEMPGEAFNCNAFGEAVKMKMYYDLYNMTIFMAGDAIGKFKTDKDIQAALNDFSERVGGNKSNLKDVKKIDENGYEGMEGLVESIAGSFKIRLLQKNNIVYIIMLGSINKSNISMSDADHFFNSFHGLENTVKNENVKFELPDKAFLINLTGVPKKNDLLEQRGTSESWNSTVYDYSDLTNQIYYLIQIREVKGGYYNSSDSVFFKQFKTNLKPQFEKIIIDSIYHFNTYPAYRLDGVAKTNDLKYSTLSVIRGNRIYTIFTVSALTTNPVLIDGFFNSMQLPDYKKGNWQSYYGPGFYTSGLSPFQKKINSDSTFVTENRDEHYFSFDSIQATSYDVLKEPLSKYFWYKTDTGFYSDRLKEFSTDSLLEKKITRNGNLNGMEAVWKVKDLSMLLKIRLFVSGDTLYKLYAHIPLTDNKDCAKFFDDFRLLNETPPSIFTDKSNFILNTFKNSDSSEFEKAVDVFDKLKFSKEDLPFLHKAFIDKYRDLDSDNYGLNYKIYEHLYSLNDPSTIEFIAINYPLLGPDKEKIKSKMLVLLAHSKTDASYRLLGNFLKEGPDFINGDYYLLKRQMEDSLELTRKLFPDAFTEINNDHINDLIIDITNTLLDSNKLALTDINNYYSSIIAKAKSKIGTGIKDENEYKFESWIEVLQKINSKEGNATLHQCLKLKSNYLKSKAISSLLKNKQVVNAIEIEAVANDKTYRKNLYADLKKANKLALFPLKYRSQRSLAESYLYNSIDEDYEGSKLIYIGERFALFQGKKQKFQLFKIVVENGEDEKEEYLGVAGPFSINPSILEPLSEDAIGGYFHEKLDSTRITAQLIDYLKRIEPYTDK